MWSVLKFAARAALWRGTPDPPAVGLPAVVALALILAVVRVVIQLAEALPAPAFTPYGLNALAAWLAIALIIAALFMRPERRATALAAMIAFMALTEVVLAALALGLARVLAPAAPSEILFSLFPTLNVPGAWRSVELGLTAAVFLAPAIWWIGGMFAIVRSVETAARLRLLGKVAALWATLVVAKLLVPHAPAFIGPRFDPHTANAWEFLRAQYLARKSAPDVAATGTLAADHPQDALLQAEVASLAPQQAGTTDVYAIGVAGWSELDVFTKEIDGAFAAIAQILPIREHTMRLLNNPETTETAPRASRHNFAAAVHAVAQVMDKDEDVLLLVMSSHGSAAGFALQLPGGSTQVLSPPEVKSVLDAEGIKNRVVIVSACFSGVFVEPLANDDTIVLTAADAKSTSFGCAAGRDWTYFGDAFFRQGLQPGTDFQHAFDRARLLIRSWEMLDRLPPSNPLAHFGPALVGKLEPVLEARLRAGP